MINVFVETNFLIKLSLKEEDCRFAYKLLKYAEQKKISLHIPSFCISEAYWVLSKKHKEHVTFKNGAHSFIDEALRGSHTKNSFIQYKDLEIDIERKINKELKMLDTNIDRVLKISQLIPISHKSHKKGIAYRSSLDLVDEPDGFIVAAIDDYIVSNKLSTQKNIFVTTDTKTMANKIELRLLMKKRKVLLVTDFKSAVDALEREGIL